MTLDPLKSGMRKGETLRFVYLKGSKEEEVNSNRNLFQFTESRMTNLCSKQLCLMKIVQSLLLRSIQRLRSTTPLPLKRKES